MSKFLWTLFGSSSWQNFKYICTDCPPAVIGVKSDFVILVKNIASRDVLAVFTKSIHSSIKNSTTTFDGSYGRCGRSDKLNSFVDKKSSALPTLGQRNGSATCGTFVLSQSPFAV